MTEQHTEEDMKFMVDDIRLGLMSLAETPEITAAAFYAKPPWKTEGKNDVDLLIVTNDEPSEGTTNTINQRLEKLAKGKLPIDAWILTSPQLKLRMKRIAGVNSKMPPILRSTSEWNEFGFVPILGEDYLTTTITECYINPESGGPIPPSSSERKLFVA
jgi:hypothetical protein